MAEYDEDELEEFAEDHGITVDEAEDFLDAIEESDAWEEIKELDPGSEEFEESMLEMAEYLDVDVSDLYDMYYGYPIGSHGRG